MFARILRNKTGLFTAAGTMAVTGNVVFANSSVTDAKIQASKPTTVFSSNGTIERVTLSIEELNPGYRTLHKRYNDVASQATTVAIVSPTISGFWLIATQQRFSRSVVAIASLITGGMILAERMMQIKRMKEYTQLSLITNSAGPTTSPATNNRIRQIIAGDNPQVKLNTHGLTIYGTMGDVENPSQALQNTLARIHARERVVLPECVLTKEAETQVNLTHGRWLSRLTLPISILNLLILIFSDPKNRKTDDIVVAAAAGHNIADYLSGWSVAEAREKLSSLLVNCKTPQEVIQVLIENKILNEGGMSFLNEWLKDQQSVAIRVGRAGSAILYKNHSPSFGGPYPVQFFPNSANTAARVESQCIEDTSSTLKPR